MMLIVLTWFAFQCLFQAGLYRENTVQMARAPERSVIALQGLKRKKRFSQQKKKSFLIYYRRNTVFVS